ncbi:hypothetical protein D3C87_1701940 [compost metagenome]
MRTRAEDEGKIVAKPKQLWLSVAIRDRHQRPFFGQFRQRVVRLLRHVDSAAPFGKIGHGCFRAQRGFSCRKPRIDHRLFHCTTTPFGHVVINVRLRLAQGLPQTLKIGVLQCF